MLSVVPGQRVAQRFRSRGGQQSWLCRRSGGHRERMPARAAPRLIYVATEDWHFLSHCLAMARAARAAGFEVHVATNVTEDAASIRGEGFILHAMRFGRGRLSPLRTLRPLSTVRQLSRLG